MADYDGPPPTKASLMKWWKMFTSKDSKKQQQQQQPPSSGYQQRPPIGGASPRLSSNYVPPGRGLETGKDGKGRVFGVSLEQSLQYASVAISMVGQ